MTLARYVRGYDKKTGRLGAECRLPASGVGAVHRLIAANPDDPALFDPHTVAVIRDAARDAA